MRILLLIVTLAISLSPNLAWTEESQGVPTGNGPIVEVPQTPSHTVVWYGGVWSKYLFQDFALMASDCPVFQGGRTDTWGGHSIDLWISEGCGGFANELDLSYFYDGSFTVADHTFTWEAKLAYYVSNANGNGMFDTFDDDLVYSHLQVGYPMRFGDATVTPYSRSEFIEGTGLFPYFMIERPGIQMNLPLSSQVSVQVEVAKAFNLTDNGASPTQLTLGITRSVSDGWSVTAKSKASGQGSHFPAPGTDIVFGLDLAWVIQ